MPGSLAHSPADVVRRLLINRGMGEQSTPVDPPRWSVYAHREPDRPDDCITVYDTAGTTGDRNNVDNERDERQGINLKIRCVDQEDGVVKGNAIAVDFDQTPMTQVVMGSSTYLVYTIVRTGALIPIGKESDSDRVALSLNALVCIRQLS